MLNAFLGILNSEGLIVPMTLAGLLKSTKTKPIIRTTAPGKYLHIGLEKQLKKLPPYALLGYDAIVLDIDVDGLPLYKSSSETLWPILGRVVNISKIDVILIGTYLGKKKPFNVDTYLHDLTIEIKELKEHGLILNSRELKVEIRAFICDTPARSFMCDIMGHNSLVGCSKCYQKAKRIHNVTTFSTTAARLRTDDEFRERRQPEFHKDFYRSSPSELEKIGIQMITQFPLVPMHLLDLGVTKRMLNILLNGISNYKISEENKSLLSTRLMSLGAYIPKDFQRKPRSFDDICRWKATEFRQFILYTGPVVLKNIIPVEVYNEFLLLFGYRLLSTPHNLDSNINNIELELKALKGLVTQQSNTIKTLKEDLSNRDEIIIKELASINIFVRDMASEKKENADILQIFPIKNIDELQRFEDNIPNLDEQALLNAIKKIIQRGGIAKNLHHLLGKDIFLNFNYDGVQTKQTFKQYININDILYKAVSEEVVTKENFIFEIKKGFKNAKNRVHKATCLARKQK
ncbi:uncharacterized protein [Eurosta solidaginis]|uniref:uncharacterized protein n=1 Tax=Eurosta solidaginis TaxID=178769 RepID=UPI003530DBEF